MAEIGHTAEPLGKFCDACQAIPKHGFCLVGDCPNLNAAMVRAFIALKDKEFAAICATLKRNRAALDLIDPARPLQYATTMDLMRKDMDAAIAKAEGRS